MADVKISELPSGSTLVGTEIIPVVQGGDTAKITVNQIEDKIVGSGVAGLVTKGYVDDTKADIQSKQIISGNGLTGGGDLSADRTLNVASANDGITVNADNIQLNTIDNVTTTSTTKPLSANQGKVLNDNINVHKDNIDNPHDVTKAQVGLSSVDNTTDLDKPVSTAQQTALNLKVDKAKQVIAGNGLTGGGDLSADRTLNVGATDDSVIIGADGIKVDTQNTLTSTSITKPLAANQGKVLNESLVQLGADLGDNIEPALAEIINHQNGRIKALEDLVKNMLFKAGQFDTIDIVKQLNIWGGTNLVIVGTAAPSVEPDFIGQMYINTTDGTIYQSKGLTSFDWKQTSN